MITTLFIIRTFYVIFAEPEFQENSVRYNYMLHYLLYNLLLHQFIVCNNIIVVLFVLY